MPALPGGAVGERGGEENAGDVSKEKLGQSLPMTLAPKLLLWRWLMRGTTTAALGAVMSIPALGGWRSNGTAACRFPARPAALVEGRATLAVPALRPGGLACIMPLLAS
jgi:hypothetical protein